MAKKSELDQPPLTQRVASSMMQLLKGSPEIIAADYGISADIEWSKTTAGDTRAERKTTRARNRARNLNQQSYDRSRRKRYADYREMMDEVPEMNTALQVLIDFVFGGHSASSIEISYGDGYPEELKKIVQAAWTSVGGSNFFVDVFKEGTYLGDSFSELIYSQAGLIAERPLRADLADVNLNEYSQLVSYSVKNSDSAVGTNNNNGYTLSPVQVLHYAPDALRGHRYGRSMWASSRKLWRQSEATEDVMAILSLLQASARKSVAYPLPANIRPDQVDEFLDNMRSDNWSTQIFDKDGKMRRRITSMLAMDDLIYPYREGSEKPQFHNEPPADLLQLIEVLRYLQEKYFISAGVPAALCGFERNVNSRATLEQQGLQFVRTVQRKQQDVVGLVYSVLARAQAAAGVTPDLNFEVKMPPISSFDEKLRAEVDMLKAQTAKILGSDLGLDMRFILSKVMKLGDEEVNMILESIELGNLGTTEHASIELTKEIIHDGEIAHAIESIADLVSNARGSGYELLRGS